MLENLGQLVLRYPSWSYAIIAFGIILQGELTVLFSMYLIADGDISWFGFIATALATFFIAETFLYFLGKNLRNTKIGEWFRQKIPYRNKIEDYIKKSVFKVLIVSKFILGSTIVVIFSIGWSGVRFKKFLKAHILSVVIWLPVVSVLAYSLVYGLWYLKSIEVFKNIEIGLAFIAFIIIAGEYILKKLFRGEIFIEKKAEELGKIIKKNLTP